MDRVCQYRLLPTLDLGLVHQRQCRVEDGRVEVFRYLRFGYGLGGKGDDRIISLLELFTSCEGRVEGGWVEGFQLDRIILFGRQVWHGSQTAIFISEVSGYAVD